jgi:hypothetical protein
MDSEIADDFVSKAIGHAKEHWCLDDEEVVREWCRRRADCDTPETLVDETAVRYGLIHATDDADAARAARQLLDEYEDVIGKESGKAVLERLSGRARSP